ncbi:TetR/AcrR family transcriptional regulator [Puerhibacterium puerhi]|uniref:TetR/AcrR family transcriptional regulator n=1 Tax=Puerhibacterium puerhi TaxID=2692623 RepID=UPI00135896E6|nr:TetR/AcrR family transcriptional regulator [Puerhibacterium puerhi]
MPATPDALDRRAALKARHRQAIVAAAAALMDERGSARFSVDELAARADVSRRTVFNHFATLDDVVIAAASTILGDVVDELGARAGAAGPDADVLDQMAAATRAEHLVPLMARLVRMLGGESGAGTTLPAREAALVQRTFALLDERLTATMVGHHAELDDLAVELLVVAFMAGALMLFRHWYAATGAVDDARSRRLWDELQGHLVDLLRHGQGAPQDAR